MVPLFRVYAWSSATPVGEPTKVSTDRSSYAVGDPIGVRWSNALDVVRLLPLHRLLSWGIPAHCCIGLP